MAGAMGSALEWALALLRMPGERHALRQKPLPVGMDRLLGIAAGVTPDVLADTALALGEPESRVREAARFYVREILLFPQADAYRVLGVAPDANAEQIKIHHRLLQHWLHPDRLHSEDDAVFATRVNSAWNRLRTPERREAYDQALRQDRPPEVFDSNGLQRGVHAWTPDADVPRERWLHRLPMLALSVACLVLVLLILEDMGSRPEAREWLGGRQGGNDAAEDAMAISVPRRESDDAESRSGKGIVREKPAMEMTGQALRERLPARAAAIAAVNVVKPAVPMQSGTHVQVPVVAPAQATATASNGSTRPRQALEAEPAQSRSLSQKTAVVPPSFARIQSARQAGDQLLRYMGSTNRPPPPIWNSPAIQSSADQLREELHDAGRVRFSDQQWRIGDQMAMLMSGYTVQGVDAGMLTVDMAWREGRWLVTGLSMERAR